MVRTHLRAPAQAEHELLRASTSTRFRPAGASTTFDRAGRGRGSRRYPTCCRRTAFPRARGRGRRGGARPSRPRLARVASTLASVVVGIGGERLATARARRAPLPTVRSVAADGVRGCRRRAGVGEAARRLYRLGLRDVGVCGPCHSPSTRSAPLVSSAATSRERRRRRATGGSSGSSPCGRDARNAGSGQIVGPAQQRLGLQHVEEDRCRRAGDEDLARRPPGARRVRPVASSTSAAAAQRRQAARRRALGRGAARLNPSRP